MSRSKAYKTTIALVCLPLLLAVAAFCWHLKGKIHQDRNILSEEEARDPGFAYGKALEAYRNDKLDEAASYLIHQPFSFVALEDGCSLLVSVFAEQKNWRVLEKVSSLCIESGKDLDISYEGLAFSKAAMGKVEEAVTKLQQDLGRHDSPRMRVSLARLYLMSARDDEAARHYLKAVELADVWSMWVTHALKIKPLVSHPGFLAGLMDLVVRKPQRIDSIEKQIAEKAAQLGLKVSGPPTDPKHMRRQG